MTRLTDEKLRALNVTWQKMEPDTTIAAAFAELVERREADAAREALVRKLKTALISARGFLRGVAQRSELGRGAVDLLNEADDIGRILAEIP